MSKGASLRDRAASLTASASISVESSHSGIPSAALTLEEAIRSDRLNDFIAQAEAAGVAAADAELNGGAKKKKRRYNPRQFFIVFSPEGPTPPTVVHSTHSAALHAAWDMTRKHEGMRFFVMGSMSCPCVVASAIEAASAGETTEIGSTEGESATAKPGRPEGASS